MGKKKQKLDPKEDLNAGPLRILLLKPDFKKGELKKDSSFRQFLIIGKNFINYIKELFVFINFFFIFLLTYVLAIIPFIFITIRNWAYVNLLNHYKLMELYALEDRYLKKLNQIEKKQEKLNRKKINNSLQGWIYSKNKKHLNIKKEHLETKIQKIKQYILNLDQKIENEIKKGDILMKQISRKNIDKYIILFFHFMLKYGNFKFYLTIIFIIFRRYLFTFYQPLFNLSGRLIKSSIFLYLIQVGVTFIAFCILFQKNPFEKGNRITEWFKLMSRAKYAKRLVSTINKEKRLKILKKKIRNNQKNSQINTKPYIKNLINNENIHFIGKMYSFVILIFAGFIVVGLIIAFDEENLNIFPLIMQPNGKFRFEFQLNQFLQLLVLKPYQGNFNFQFIVIFDYFILIFAFAINYTLITDGIIIQWQNKNNNLDRIIKDSNLNSFQNSEGKMGIFLTTLLIIIICESLIIIFFNAFMLILVFGIYEILLYIWANFVMILSEKSIKSYLS